jgi:rubrerythrin
MTKQTQSGMPTANLAINKSRLKVYNKKSDVPTYYLQKGQEFQIELFNPTKDTILAKISLNGKPIAQGGLVLRPAERVFLDRYIDVARKFKFDTYEVANTKESQKAIEDNGDFKVEFYREQYMQFQSSGPSWGGEITLDGNWNKNWGTLDLIDLRGTAGVTTTNFTYNSDNTLGDEFTTNSLSVSANISAEPVKKNPIKTIKGSPLKKKKTRSKSIETGRVEKGSTSNQELETVSMIWETYAFHTIEYKMLPVSQKVNTVQDMVKAVYCVECGTKQKKGNKFCPNCGNKQ